MIFSNPRTNYLNYICRYHQIREALNTATVDNDEKIVKKFTDNIKNTFDSFSKTRLTEKEKLTADELKLQISELNKILLSNNKVSLKYTDEILNTLNKLSEIQLDESKLIMKQVEKQYASIKASSEFAFAIIIVILIVLQILVFSGESLIPLFKPKDPSLN